MRSMELLTSDILLKVKEGSHLVIFSIPDLVKYTVLEFSNYCTARGRVLNVHDLLVVVMQELLCELLKGDLLR